jgi:uncharacterized protein (TIGR00730 family)
VAKSAPRLAEIGDGVLAEWWWCGLIQGPKPTGIRLRRRPPYRWIPGGNHPVGRLLTVIWGPERAVLTLPQLQRTWIPMNKLEKLSKLRKICVYCGSGPGTDPAFVQAATEFGTLLARNGIGLVYGGGGNGLMGALARAVRDHGGSVTGIIPEFLTEREHAMRRGQELIVTRDMHERKQKMFEMADAFVALPGGIGTLEELVEQLTWAQLGRHRKPVLAVNIAGFWEPLCALIDHMKALEFIRAEFSFDLLIADNVTDILPMLARAAEAVPEEDKRMIAADPGRL